MEAAKASPQLISFLSGSVAPPKSWIHREAVITARPWRCANLGGQLRSGAGAARHPSLGSGTEDARERRRSGPGKPPDAAPLVGRGGSEASARPEEHSPQNGGAKLREPASPGRPVAGGGVQRDASRGPGPGPLVPRGAPQLQADVTAARAGLRGSRWVLFDADKPSPTKVLVRVPLLRSRPSLPTRIIGYLISPGLNSWQRGRWFATGNKT